MDYNKIFTGELLEDLTAPKQTYSNQQKISETPPLVFPVVKNLFKVTNKNSTSDS